jgi:hypothetical protein
LVVGDWGKKNNGTTDFADFQKLLGLRKSGKSFNEN